MLAPRGRSAAESGLTTRIMPVVVVCVDGSVDAATRRLLLGRRMLCTDQGVGIYVRLQQPSPTWCTKARATALDAAVVRRFFPSAMGRGFSRGAAAPKFGVALAPRLGAIAWTAAAAAGS